MCIGVCRMAPGRRSGKWFDRLIRIVAVAALILLPGSRAVARPWPAAIAIDGATGKTVYARSADRLRYPASLTKVMTLYLLFKEMRAGRISKNTRLYVTPNAARQSPSKLGLRAGQHIRAEDAILALVTKSANDVAVVVAEALAGTEAAFARRMTATARKIGMKRTRFRNASGLPNPGQVTTARDMAKLALRIQRDFPKYYKYFSVRKFRFRGRNYYTHNRLLGRFRGTDGIKTGYTRASGYNLISSVRRGKKHVIGVVLGGRTARKRDRRMMAVITYALPKVTAHRPAKRRRAARATPIKPFPVKTGPVRSVSVRTSPVKTVPVRTAPVKTAPAPVVKLKQALPPPAVIPRARARAPMAPMAPMAPVKQSGPSVFASARPIDAGQLPPLRPALIHPVAATPIAPALIAPRFPAPARRPSPASEVPLKPTVLPAAAPRAVVDAAPPGWTIQIGAYMREADAKQILDLAQTRARRILLDKQAFTLVYTKDNRVIYRARFKGFTKTSALDTCRMLKRLQIGCYTLAP